MSISSLSILIPSTPDRRDMVNNLYLEIQRQIETYIGPIAAEHYIPHPNGLQYRCTFKRRINNQTVQKLEFIVLEDEKVLTIGEKRELMYKMATGLYSFQLDSDDWIAPNALDCIFRAMLTEPDCITFEEKCTMNGEYKRSNHALKYKNWQDNFDGYDYVRSPFYKDVIKTSIAQSVPFPHIRYNEDEQWSMALLPHLTTEVHIPQEIYYYIYEPKDTHQERYGIK